MIERYFEGIVPPPGQYSEADLKIQRVVADAAANADAACLGLATMTLARASPARDSIAIVVRGARVTQITDRNVFFRQSQASWASTARVTAPPSVRS